MRLEGKWLASTADPVNNSVLSLNVSYHTVIYYYFSVLPKANSFFTIEQEKELILLNLSI